LKQIKKPTHNTGDVFSDCVSKTARAGRAKLLAVKTDIEKEAELYDKRGKRQTLYRTEAAEKVGVDVTTKQMVNLYNNHLARKGSVGRPIYDEIKAIPKLGWCPLCGIGKVSTLDHYLPKTIFPQLAVTPTNLIAACKDCNTTKKDKFVADPNKQTIHPYYDNFDDKRWLFVEIVEGNPFGIRYVARPPSSWKNRKRERAKHHFKSFNLAEPYRTSAITVIGNIQHRLEDLYTKGGKDPVHDHLAEELDSRNHSPNASINDWETALYEAMAQSNWFCDGGFRYLPD